MTDRHKSGERLKCVLATRKGQVVLAKETAAQAMGGYQRIRRRLLALLIAVCGTVLIFGASLQSAAVHEAIEYCGFMLITIGIAGRLWSVLYIGGRKSAEIVSCGPYSVMRNPLYFFSTIAAAGAGAQMGSLAAMVGFDIVSAAALHLVIFREEQYLTGRLGKVYADYVRRVPRFMPNPLLYADKAEISFRPNILVRTLLDGLVFFISIPVFEAIEFAQKANLIPVFFRIF